MTTLVSSYGSVYVRSPIWLARALSRSKVVGCSPEIQHDNFDNRRSTFRVRADCHVWKVRVPRGVPASSESGPLREVHLSRHKWPGGSVNQDSGRLSEKYLIIFHGLKEGICCPLKLSLCLFWNHYFGKTLLSHDAFPWHETCLDQSSLAMSKVDSRSKVDGRVSAGRSTDGFH